MNIQIASLRDVTPNGDGSLPAACASAAATPGSTTEGQQCEEVKPEDRHEMPVEGRRVIRDEGDHAGAHPVSHVDEPAHAQHVSGMKRGEHVEESAAGPPDLLSH